MAEGLSQSERIVAAYKRLAASAEVLSAASDEFSKPISELDAVFQRLNLGLITWERITGGEDEYDNYWSRDVGYTQMNNRWGLAIRDTSGNHHTEERELEQWLFNDAPRSYRIEALDKLPDLIEQLIKSSEKTAKKIRDKTVEARELAAALKKASAELEQQRKERRS